MILNFWVPDPLFLKVGLFSDLSLTNRIDAPIYYGNSKDATAYQGIQTHPFAETPRIPLGT